MDRGTVGLGILALAVSAHTGGICLSSTFSWSVNVESNDSGMIDVLYPKHESITPPPPPSSFLLSAPVLPVLYVVELNQRPMEDYWYKHR